MQENANRNLFLILSYAFNISNEFVESQSQYVNKTNLMN